MERVFIGLGSNVGARAALIDQALLRLNRKPGCSLVQVSSLFETEPVGPPQAKYLNAAAEIETRLEPIAFLGELLDIERQLGRTRSPDERNAPRTIDLDLLMFGARIHLNNGANSQLEIPHPRLTDRPFVLIPLVELDPTLRHPATGDLLASFLPVDRENDGVVMWRARSSPLDCAEILDQP
ncbi:MAG: 2-amino-4-hydroxy-6-hydroxymethyldihydropteridine diphosphokinase [Phycisphaerales bacterium]|nr:2-amino-4-hydroxy-6-hydroxymethyldihydropteridine diphosphokinase [Phycisphaerales bacterium]